MTRIRRSGLTRTEVSVIMVIVAILIGMLLPAVRKVREPANRARCMSNIRQIMIALQNYESTGSSVPSAVEANVQSERYLPTGCLGPGNVPEDRLSWMVAVLPFLERTTIYEQLDVQKGYDANTTAVQTEVRELQCPSFMESMTSKNHTNYVSMAGIGLDAAARPADAPGNGFMGYDRLTSFSMIKDGLSRTVAITETRVGLGPWARGGPSTLRGFDVMKRPFVGDAGQFGGHATGAVAAMADCSTRSIDISIHPKVLAAMITIAGGETENLD